MCPGVHLTKCFFSSTVSFFSTVWKLYMSWDAQWDPCSNLLTVENYGDDTNLQKFFGEAIWFMVIWKTHIVCLCFHSLQYNMTLKQWWHTNEFNFWGDFWFGLDPHRNHLRTFPTQQQNLTRATDNEDRESQLVEFPTKCPSTDGPN